MRKRAKQQVVESAVAVGITGMDRRFRCERLLDKSKSRDGDRRPYKRLQEVFRQAVPREWDKVSSIRIQQVGACGISPDDVGDRSRAPPDGLLQIKRGIDGNADLQQCLGFGQSGMGLT